MREIEGGRETSQDAIIVFEERKFALGVCKMSLWLSCFFWILYDSLVVLFLDLPLAHKFY